jgi:peptide/nickel transport system permease protein
MNQSEVEIPLRAELGLDAEGLAPQETPWEEFLRIFTKDYQALFGFWVLVILLLTALAGKALTEWWVVFDPEVVRLTDKFLPPLSVPSPDSIPEDRPFGGVYLMGTDELGRDVFARMFQGSFVSLSIGFVAVGISLGIGILLGGLSGFYGHVQLWFITVDTLIMRFTDAMMCFPTFFLILTAVALLPPSIYTIMIIIGLFSWMGTARFVRAEFLSIREQDFVTAAKALGIPEGRIIFRHMVPNALAPVFVSATIGVASAILTESGLSFLGFGVPPPYATWGNILSDGKGFVFDAPWLFFIPGMAIFIVVLAFNLVGEGLREALNPKLRSR